MRVDTATRLILQYLHKSILANAIEIRTDNKVDSLHDFRVAMRKTRSLLAQIRGIYPKHTVRHFSSGFTWVGKVTGGARDLDVYVQKLGDYRDNLPPADQLAIRPLQQYLVRQRTGEYRQMLMALDSDRYHQLLADWASFLEQRVPDRKPLANARKPVIEVASKRIWKVYRRVLRQGRAISPDSAHESLHELRKTCKQLRYLVEFFRSLYPDAGIEQLIRVLKSLQNNLGDFQDLSVQLAALENYKQQMMSEARVPPETIQAIDELASTLARRRDQERNNFTGRFRVFDSPKSRKQSRKIFSNHNQ